HLGGDDFDGRLADLVLAEQTQAERSRADVRARARAAAEHAKRALSDAERAEVVLGAARRAVTRAEFEALVADLVERTAGPCRQALKDAGLRPEDIRCVVAVGGSTRVPLVRRQMEAIFGRPPLTDIDPDRVVALGAGLERSVEVKPSYGLSEAEIERMLEDSIDYAEEDVRQRQVREARVEAEMILHATRESLAREAPLLADGEGERIRAAVAALERARAGEDYLDIRDAVETRSRETEPFARRMM